MFATRQKEQTQVKEETTPENYLDRDTQIKINRVDYHREVKQEQQFQKSAKLANYWFLTSTFFTNLYYSMNVKTIAGKISNFLRLYHESLQGLVQGYREVTMDAKGDFKFEKDGQTVEERSQKFEKKLGEYSSGMTQRIIKKKDE